MGKPGRGAGRTLLSGSLWACDSNKQALSKEVALHLPRILIRKQPRAFNPNPVDKSVSSHRKNSDKKQEGRAWGVGGRLLAFRKSLGSEKGSDEISLIMEVDRNVRRPRAAKL